MERGKSAPGLETLLLLSERFQRSSGARTGYCGEKGTSGLAEALVNR